MVYGQIINYLGSEPIGQFLLTVWPIDSARMDVAHVSTETWFVTEPALAVKMIARAIAAKVPFVEVADDSVSGAGDVE